MDGFIEVKSGLLGELRGGPLFIRPEAVDAYTISEVGVATIYLRNGVQLSLGVDATKEFLLKFPPQNARSH